MTWRRRLVGGAILVALGIVTTVGVAWACAGLTPRYAQSDVDRVDMGTWSAPGMRYTAGALRVGTAVLARAWVSEAARPRGIVLWTDRMPDDMQVIDARGWPWPAMYSRFELGPPRPAPIPLRVDALRVAMPALIPQLRDHVVSSSLVATSIDQWAVPLRIEWIGFGLDVVVFTMLWAGLASTRRPLRAICAPMTGRGRARFALLVVTLGFVTTVVVAQIAATRPSPSVKPRIQVRGSSATWVIGYGAAPGRSRCGATWLNGPKDAQSPGDVLPPWAQDVPLLIGDGTNRISVYVTIATGWPMRALSASARADYSVDGALTTHPTGIQLSPGPGSWLHETFRALPTRPIWRGLIVDTLAFALLWLIGIACVVRIRAIPARRRVRAGRCGVCGYDCRAAPTCSECGADAAAVAARLRI